MVETLVLRVREPKDLMQVSIEDSASAVTSAAAMLTSNTPVSRVKLERFGKTSVVLARCSGEGGNPAADQSAFEPIFRAASSVMSHYRDALGAPGWCRKNWHGWVQLGQQNRPPAVRRIRRDVACRVSCRVRLVRGCSLNRNPFSRIYLSSLWTFATL